MGFERSSCVNNHSDSGLLMLCDLVIYLPLLHLVDALQSSIMIGGYAVLTQEPLLLVWLLHSIFTVVSAVQSPIDTKACSLAALQSMKSILSVLVTH